MRLLAKLNVIFILALFGFIFMTSPALAQDCEFDDWDVNNDSYLDEDEFFDAYEGVGYYDEWNSDDEDSLSEMEWELGADEHLSAYDFGSFDDWDLNGDGMVSEQEFQDGLFDLIDKNDDGQIGEDDWSIFDDDNGIFC